MTSTEAPLLPTLDTLFQEAARLLQEGNATAAAERLQAILRRDPGHTPSLQLLGIVRTREGRTGEAVALLEKVVERDANSAEAHNNLGMALAALNRHEEALAAYRRALALEPGYVEAHNNLGNSLARIASARADPTAAAITEALLAMPGDRQ
ncbi:MAG TPA: tetratricopeptide repeat protein [Casimicrobiaceae bacterium]